jgi:hypothetical protein
MCAVLERRINLNFIVPTRHLHGHRGICGLILVAGPDVERSLWGLLFFGNLNKFTVTVTVTV